MDTVLKLTTKQRNELFAATSQRSGLRDAIIEKDFWVCWTLKQLFGLHAIGEHLIFKGGTSLSKIYKVINRFSEDIDVSIDRSFLGFGGANEPEEGNTNKEKQRRVEALKKSCQQRIVNDLLPALLGSFRALFSPSEKWLVRLDDADPDLQTLVFEYPVSVPKTAADYVPRVVKIELGARADHWPSEVATLTPYVAERFPESFKTGSCEVKVLSAERTFWEKATILHAEFHRPADKSAPARLSRHYCDVYELIKKGVAERAVGQLQLLERVAKHKALFFKCSWAKYEEAAKGSLKMFPALARLADLRRDYAAMREMFFSEPPAFDPMLAELRAWESTFNGQ